MNYRFKEARLHAGMTATEVGRRLGVTQATVSNWDAERKIPSIEMLCRLADLYGITTDYLLGRAGHAENSQTHSEPIDPAVLPAYHGGPVWQAQYGWGIVDAIRHLVVFADCGDVPLEQAGALYTFPPAFAVGYYATGKPLTREQAALSDRLWLEPISPDPEARRELRGWYQVQGSHVQNEYGQKFYLDTYGAKWLAFEMNLE